MNKVIQPIETWWKGYRFRSRLEARWAVVFESLGLNWQYEQEGLCLPDGTGYLPDFYLPDQQTYVEIKPKAEFDPENVYCKKLNRVIPPELQKISQLADWIMIAGNPHPKEYLAFNNSEYGFLWTSSWELFSGDHPIKLWVDCGYEWVGHEDTRHRIYFRDREDANVVAALANGRAARFEFGEQP